MSKAVKVADYLLRNDATIGGLIARRCFPANGVPSNCSRPYLVLTRLSDTPDRDLNGVVDQRIAKLQVEVVSWTYADAATITAAVPNAIDGHTGTVNGVTVREISADDSGDEPDGPVDLDDGEAFVGTVEINIAYLP